MYAISRWRGSCTHAPHLQLVASRAHVFVDVGVAVLAGVAALVVLGLAVPRVDGARVAEHVVLVALAQAPDLPMRSRWKQLV